MPKISFRETKPGIRIESDGAWYYDQTPIFSLIDNKAVLSYFKKQLRRHPQKGYYIENSFKESYEHAYLEEVLGFPLFVTSIINVRTIGDGDASPVNNFRLQFRLDSDEELEVDATALSIVNSPSGEMDTILILLVDRGNVPARLTRVAMFQLGAYIEKGAGNYFLELTNPACQFAIPIINNIEAIL